MVRHQLCKLATKVTARSSRVGSIKSFEMLVYD